MKRKKKGRNQKKKMVKEVPSPPPSTNDLLFQLKLEKYYKEIQRSHLSIAHVRSLLLFLLLRSPLYAIPQWITIHNLFKVKKVILLVVPGLSSSFFQHYPLPILSSTSLMFSESIQVNLPFKHNTSSLPASNVPMLYEFHPTKKIINTLFPPQKNTQNGTSELLEKQQHWKRFIKDYVLSKKMLASCSFPGYVFESEISKSLIPIGNDDDEPSSPPLDSSDVKVYAIDCEMCLTDEGHELTRVSVVNEDLDIVYDTFVKPHKPILDYLTQFSGVTSKDLDSITTRLSDVQEHLKRILEPDCILVGHSLDCDLNALHLIHHKIIDTSILFKHEHGFPYRHKLKYLCRRYLHRNIQNSTSGHNSIEDATATMELLQKAPSIFHTRSKKKASLNAQQQEQHFLNLVAKFGIQCCLLDSIENFENSLSGFHFRTKHNPEDDDAISRNQELIPLHRGPNSSIEDEVYKKNLEAIVSSCKKNIDFIHCQIYTLEDNHHNIELAVEMLNHQFTEIYNNLTENSFVLIMGDVHTPTMNNETKDSGLLFLSIKK